MTKAPNQVSLAIIPARGGSVGVRHKNLRRIGGVPLVTRAIEAALKAGVTWVIVSTDDSDIASASQAVGAHVVPRPADISTSTASSEVALLHVLDSLVVAGAGVSPPPATTSENSQQIPDIVVFVQATSPFIDPATIRAAIDRVAKDEADVVFSAKETHAFQWRLDSDGLVPVGHDIGHRPMRQERAPHYQETGAFYVMNAAGFRQAKHRFFGRVAVQVVPEETGIEIDTLTDLKICEALAPLLDPVCGIGQDRAIDVDAIVTDFDGVHTDDHAMIDIDGAEHVTISRCDGLGIAHIRDSGLPFLILSTEQNPIVRRRAEKLQVEVQHSVTDKAQVLRSWLRQKDLDPARVAYLGNDINDLSAMSLVGWPCAVADAHPDVRRAARVVLEHCGGEGAVRELCDRVLLARQGGQSGE